MLIGITVDAIERAQADEVLEILGQLQLEESAPKKVVGHSRPFCEIRPLHGKELDRHAGQLRFGRGFGARLGLGGGGRSAADNRSGGRRRRFGHLLKAALRIRSEPFPPGIAGLRHFQKFHKRFPGFLSSLQLEIRQSVIVECARLGFGVVFVLPEQAIVIRGVGELPRFEVNLSQAVHCARVFRIQRQRLLGEADSRRGVPPAMSPLSVSDQCVGVFEIELTPHLGLAELQFPLPFLLLLRVVHAFFFALVFTTTGVPRKPKRLRIWLTRYRSCEKCSGPELLVKNTNVGGRTDACVT